MLGSLVVLVVCLVPDSCYFVCFPALDGWWEQHIELAASLVFLTLLVFLVGVVVVVVVAVGAAVASAAADDDADSEYDSCELQ